MPTKSPEHVEFWAELLKLALRRDYYLGIIPTIRYHYSYDHVLLTVIFLTGFIAGKHGPASEDTFMSTNGTVKIKYEDEPYFHNVLKRNYTAAVGQPAYLHCIVKNLGDREVILSYLWCLINCCWNKFILTKLSRLVRLFYFKYFIGRLLCWCLLI